MLRIIHSSFELDLSNYDITITEENNWFSDRFFTKYSLPFTFQVTDEINEALGDILSMTSISKESLFEVKLEHVDKLREAVLEVEELNGRTATAAVRFGFEELPNYDKKLSELPLDDFEIVGPDTIYTHADDIITQTWPDVSHNFVQVHTDKFSTEDAQWEAFEGFINKRVGSSWVENEYDAIEDKQLNKNIMQPQPYIPYVVQKGVEDAGFTLAGNLFENSAFKRALFSEISDYYSTINTDAQEFYVHAGEHDSVNSNNYGTYSEELVLTEKGRYKIAGNIVLRLYRRPGSVRLKLNGNTIWSTSFYSFSYKERFQSIDIDVDFDAGASATLSFESTQHIYALIAGEWVEDQMICDLTITQLAAYDGSGNLLPTLVLPTEIKLAKCVPDMTFGQLITVLKNWKNLDVYPEGNLLYFNFIEDQLEAINPIDLSDYEVKAPVRRLSKGNTFLLKFRDIDSEDYLYEKLFISAEGSFSSGFKTNDETKEIIIEAIPLPIVNKLSVKTAHHFIDDKSLVKVILFDGALASDNLAEDNTELLVPYIYETNYQKWISLRINGEEVEWSFRMYEEDLRLVELRSKIMAYKKLHIIKSINKDQLKRGVWQVTLKTETLKQIIN